ncbi:hypothetical protein [Butyrivibrio sp. AD3002]|uniref:hypothetical protein n=1 Tax=Butyrivibrio sp. AD3002 TaxID=1280670 RepID=UPI0003B3C88F|nr:hypothetical protein [Butyrivibrio sp. AD3002]
MIAKTVTDDELRRFIIIANGAKNFNITDRLKEIRCPVMTTGTFDTAPDYKKRVYDFFME